MESMADAHGLVVGIAAYQHIRPLPPVVVSDARDVYAFLIDPARGGHRPENTRLLIDAQATGQALRRELADLAERSSPDGTVFLYLSGHGIRIRSGPRAGDYLLPADAASTSPAALARTAISGDEFGQALGRLPARRVLVVFDCCHAGGIGTPKSAAGPDLGPDAGLAEPGLSEPGLSEAGYEALASGRGRAILASSRDDEFSVVLPGAANSLFTLHLLAGLDGGVASDDGLVRVFDLFEYVQPKVTADSPGQHPVFKGNLEENFPVALYGGGRRGTVARYDDGFRYDAYISYVDREPDTTWVWNWLLPRLEQAGLRVAVSGDVGQPGVARVVNMERGIEQSRRTLVILSPAYLRDGFAHFENVLAQNLGVSEGRYRLVPVQIARLDGDLPTRLSMLTSVNLAQGPRAEREFKRLLNALEAPLPSHAGWRREPRTGA